MGIDVYLEWDGMSKAENEAQCTGFATAGAVGYLREAYHGGPYATRFLFREHWGSKDNDGLDEMDRMVRAISGSLAGAGMEVAIGPPPPLQPELAAKPPKLECDPSVRVVDDEEHGQLLYYPEAVLLARVEMAARIAAERHMKLYKASVADAEAEGREYARFVAKYIMLARAGKNPRVHVSS